MEICFFHAPVKLTIPCYATIIIIIIFSESWLQILIKPYQSRSERVIGPNGDPRGEPDEGEVVGDGHDLLGHGGRLRPQVGRVVRQPRVPEVVDLAGRLAEPGLAANHTGIGQEYFLARAFF